MCSPLADPASSNPVKRTGLMTLVAPACSASDSLSLARTTTLIGTLGASARTVSVMRMVESSRPAEISTFLALSIRTALSVSSREASAAMMLQPSASASASRSSLGSITTMQLGSVPRSINSATASEPEIP